MKKILLVLLSSLTFLAISSSANAIKVGALYLDTAGFFGEINIDGALIGGASLKANSFADIVKIYRKVKRKW